MIDGILGTQQYQTAKKLLDVAAMRHAALASNIANVETPGYKRMDVAASFEAQLIKASSSNNVNEIRSLQPQITTDYASKSVRADGNNVSMDRELMEMKRNSVEYDFLTQYLSNNLNRIQTAIKTSGQ